MVGRTPLGQKLIAVHGGNRKPQTDRPEAAGGFSRQSSFDVRDRNDPTATPIGGFGVAPSRLPVRMATRPRNGARITILPCLATPARHRTSLGQAMARCAAKGRL